MQFKVPQFLDIEDKIFGPFTFKEFVYLTGGVGLSFVLYKALGLVLGAVPIFIVMGLSMALTFYRPNDKPFVFMLEAGLKYIFQNKLYIWERRKKETDNKEGELTPEQTKEMQRQRERLENNARLGGDKLRDLAWSLDILDINRHDKDKR